MKAFKTSQKARPRLTDVAKLAGVSLGSASRALSDPDAVKDKTLNAVRAAVEQLSYVRDGMARSLVLRRSFTVGAILPTINNPVYADFVHSLQQRLGASKYALFVSAHEYNRDSEVEITGRLLERGVDGVLLVGTDHDSRVVDLLTRANVPYLYTWSVDQPAGKTCVGFQNRKAMQQIAQYLLKLGHRHFAVLSGHVEYNERARERLDGILDALTFSGTPLPKENILYGEFSVQAGREGFRNVLRINPKPTAIICSTDLVAAGVMAEAASRKIKVPQQLSVTGFDNIVYSSVLTPQLTTVDVPTWRMGQESGDAILRLIEGMPTESCILETKLVVRGSTASPPGKKSHSANTR